MLKLKTASFKTRTRSVSLDAPTQLADRIFRTAREALRREADGTAYRLLGVGISHLAPASDCDPADLVDDGAGKRAAAERAMDKVRAKFGGDAVRRPFTRGDRWPSPFDKLGLRALTDPHPEPVEGWQ